MFWINTFCGEIHVAIIETFESIKDAFEGMHSENIEN